MTMDMEGDLLSLSEAAEVLRVSKRTVLRWMERGKLQGVRVGERLVKVSRHSLKNVITSYVPERMRKKKAPDFNLDPFLTVDEWAPSVPESVPTDLACEHDHHLYGTSRRRE